MEMHLGSLHVLASTKHGHIVALSIGGTHSECSVHLEDHLDRALFLRTSPDRQPNFYSRVYGESVLQFICGL